MADTSTSAWRMMFYAACFLKVRHDRLPAFRWQIPLFISLLVTVLLIYGNSPLLGENGTIKQVRDFVALVAAFFLAALAAVATFNNPQLDLAMGEDPPELDTDKMNRRSFVCLLFGYLSMFSFLYFFFLVFSGSIAPYAREILGSNFELARTVFVFFFTFGLCHMLCLSLLGIWFLTVKVHQK